MICPSQNMSNKQLSMIPLLWRCFNSTGVGDIDLIEAKMNSFMYIRILSEHLLPSVRRLFQGNFIFQRDNYLKHTAKRTREYLHPSKLNYWMGLVSSDLNPIENLWHKLKFIVVRERIAKKTHLQSLNAAGKV